MSNNLKTIEQLEAEIERLNEINNHLERQLFQLYKEKDLDKSGDLETDYQSKLDS